VIAQTIQLALAPVFVLVAIGHLLATLSARLSRVADRARELQDLYGRSSGKEHETIVVLIRATDRRIVLIGKSIRAMVLSSLFIGAAVSVLFLEEILGIDLQLVAAAVFLIAIALLMWGLVLFLRETQVASDVLRIPSEMRDPKA